MAGTGQDSVELRGKLRVAPKAVQRIAQAACLEVPGSISHRSGVGLVGSTLPDATVALAGPRATVDISIAAEWGQSLVGISSAVQARVIERLRDLAGVKVDRANIDIAHVELPDVENGRRVR